MINPQNVIVTIVLFGAWRADQGNQALKTILSQTHENLEILLAVSHATPKDESIFAQTMLKDSRVKRIQPKALSEVLTAVTGTWVCMVHVKDMLHNQRIEHLLAHAYEHDCDGVFDSIMSFDSDGRRGAKIITSAPKPMMKSALLSAYIGNDSIGTDLAWPAIIDAMRRDNKLISHVNQCLYFCRRASSPNQKAAKTQNDVVVIVRQRITGATNGSSTYLLAICRYLVSQGRKVSMVWPNTGTFGRWPVLVLKSDMDFLQNVSWRGAFKIKNLVFSLDPKVYIIAVLSVAEAILFKLKLIKKKYIKPFKSALLTPMTPKDQVFVADAAKGAKAIITDYAFCAPYLPYCMSPLAPSLVIMHDLFSSRDAQFKTSIVKDDYGTLSYVEEIKLLNQTDGVVAIQKEEAQHIANDLTKPVIIAPMAVEPVANPQVGDDNCLFFVGSQAAPNVIGLAWFFDQVWPLVLSQNPDLILKVAGSVGGHFQQTPKNVQILGMVDDLTPLYRQAGLVISPLTTGSGLKIKMIEALAMGKAMVVTKLTLQGVEDLVEPCVAEADTPDAFASAIIRLLSHTAKREALCRLALSCVETHFSAKVCFDPIAKFLAPPAA